MQRGKIRLGLLAAVLAACAAPTAWAESAAHARRVEIVQMVEAGEEFERDEFGRVELPEGYVDLSHNGLIHVREQPLMVFFITWVGFSPDPYCGYEYSVDPNAVLADPLGSGSGEVESLGDAWYWICAS